MTGEVAQVTFTPGRVDGQLWVWLSAPGGLTAALLTPAAVTLDGVAVQPAAAVAALYLGRCSATLGRFDAQTGAYTSADVVRIGPKE